MVTNTSGKKKTAIARATIRDGSGKVRIDSKPVELVDPEMAQLKILEPFRITDGDLRADIDIDVSIEGGGVMGQADAARTAIARGLVDFTNDAELREAFMEFDRSQLVNDVRQSEPKKWGGPGARARYQKSYR